MHKIIIKLNIATNYFYLTLQLLFFCIIMILNVLETNQDHSVIFEVTPKSYISGSFVDYKGYSISSKVFLTTVVDITVI